MKDGLGRKIMNKFAKTSRAKTYSYLKTNNDQNEAVKRTKSVS